jgi:predicted RNA polymerase sigma factor
MAERERAATAGGDRRGSRGTLDGDDRMAHNHPLEAVRAHLLERAGELAASRDSYRMAARMTASIPEQRYLALKAARLVD